MPLEKTGKPLFIPEIVVQMAGSHPVKFERTFMLFELSPFNPNKTVFVLLGASFAPTVCPDVDVFQKLLVMLGLLSTPPANPAIFAPPLVDTNPVE